MILTMWLACVTENNVALKVSSTLCSRYEECDKGSFEANYDDQEDCVDSTEPTFRDYYACLASECDFNQQNANACIAGYAAQSCEDVSSGKSPSECEAVYEGCTDVDIAACALDAAF